ncbi:hypothetical protein L7F22_033502 [Adiantum nelumboides]|nr:hypothetical protein [Adiantum nelumboides]
MKLRSGCVSNRTIDQEASSRIQPLEPPLIRKGCILKRCVFIDDEAHVDEDSNKIVENIELMETNVDVEDPLDYDEDESDASDQEQDGGFKKESEEYIEKTQEDALPPVSHGATQLTIGCSSHAIPSNKDKGHMDPPSTSRIPTPSSMPLATPFMAIFSMSSLVATKSSMAPSTLCMLATTPPMTPSSMVATTSFLVHTTSFVVVITWA